MQVHTICGQLDMLYCRIIFDYLIYSNVEKQKQQLLTALVSKGIALCELVMKKDESKDDQHTESTSKLNVVNNLSGRSSTLILTLNNINFNPLYLLQWRKIFVQT